MENIENKILSKKIVFNSRKKRIGFIFIQSGFKQIKTELFDCITTPPPSALAKFLQKISIITSNVLMIEIKYQNANKIMSR